MPTIEVEESDQVFVVKGRGTNRRGGYHELGPNDLVITMRAIAEPNPRDLIELQPYALVYVGGTQVNGFEGFLFVRGRQPTECVVEVIIQQDAVNSMPALMQTIRRLEPFVFIRQPMGDELIDPNARIDLPSVETSPIEEPPVDRVSRYDREPVI